MTVCTCAMNGIRFYLIPTHHSLPLPGSRSAVVNMEVRSEEALTLNRKCVIVRWKGLTFDRFRDLLKRGAGSLLILLPRGWGEEEAEVVQEWMELEEELMAEDVPIPVYLAWEDEPLLQAYSQATRLAERERNSSVAASERGREVLVGKVAVWIAVLP